MSVKGLIVTDLSARVLTVEKVKTFGRWNSQILHELDEKQIDLPAVFVEFLAIPYVSEGGRGLQKSETTLRFHFMFEEIDDSVNAVTDAAMFDFVEEVHKVLQGFAPTNAGTLNRVSEADDIEHDRVSDWTADYDVLIHDTSACDLDGLDSGLLTLVLTKQINVTIITLPAQGNNIKIINWKFAKGGDNDLILDIDINSAGSYSADSKVNLDSVVYEIDSGAGFGVVALPFVAQIGDKLKVTAVRTDDTLESGLVTTGIS